MLGPKSQRHQRHLLDMRLPTQDSTGYSRTASFSLQPSPPFHGSLLCMQRNQNHSQHSWLSIAKLDLEALGSLYSGKSPHLRTLSLGLIPWSCSSIGFWEQQPFTAHYSQLEVSYYTKTSLGLIERLIQYSNSLGKKKPSAMRWVF